MPFLDTLKTLRNKAGLRKAELARKAGVSTDTITRIEAHISTTEETLGKVVNALNNEPVFDGAPTRPAIVFEKVVSGTSAFGEGKASPKKPRVAQKESDEVGT